MTVDPYLPAAMTIAHAVRDRPHVFTWTFDVPGGFAFRPGQFNMLYLHGVGEVPISISGDPADPARLVHTIRAVGTVTRVMDRLGAGDVLGVRGPYGSCCDSPPARWLRGRQSRWRLRPRQLRATTRPRRAGRGAGAFVVARPGGG